MTDDFEGRYEDWEDHIGYVQPAPPGDPGLRNSSRGDSPGPLAPSVFLVVAYFLTTLLTTGLAIALIATGAVLVGAWAVNRLRRAWLSRHEPHRPEPEAEALQASGDEPGRQAGGDPTSGREGEGR